MELATVKKGTPLYGQPSWWGDPDEDDEGDNSASSSSKRNGDKNSANKNTRPSNLGLSGEDAAGAGASGKAAARMEGERIRPVQSATYMEIPIKDDESPGSVDGSKDSGTPAKSVSSSLSKDSLSVSPDQRQSHASKSGKDQSPSAEVNPATSFTIDLNDNRPKKSLNIGSSLSEFVPTKIRKNFRERKERATSSKVGSKESTPSKNSEERELSPMAQHKIDEIWSTVVEGKSKARLASVQATAGSSLRSPNLEDIDRLSELSEERRSAEREGDKKGIAKRPVPSKSPQLTKSTKQKSSSSTALSSSTKSPAAATATMAAAHSSASVNLSQYSDPTSYLIDRMFEGGSSSASDKEMTPEKKMYREAASYDKTAVTRKSAEKSVVRPVIDSAVSRGASASKNGAIDSPAKKAGRKPSDDDDLKITEDLSDEEIDEAVVKDDTEDKVSEAGTYTIEADNQEGEEEEEFARKRIDQVFGVVNVDNFDSEKPLIDPLRLASPGGYDNVYDDDDGNKTPLDAPSPFDDDFDDDEDSPSLVDNDNSLLVDDLPEDEDQDSDKMAATDGMQTWVSQLTALTSQKAGLSPDGRASAEEGDTSLSKKPPQGISRKRAGTGRKLPSIPIDQSPVSSEQDLRGDDDSPPGRTQDLVVNGKNTRISSQTRSRRMNNGFPDSVSQASSEAASPNTSSRSRGSVDTELLLQDTETVMAAMEARIGHKSGRERKDTYSVDSDNDNLSTVSLVNGDDDYVKPSKFKSPREALANRQQKDISAKSANNNSSSSSPASSGRKPVGRSYSSTVPPKSKSTASPRGTPSATGGTRRSVVSDVFSRRDSVDNDSIISDVSSETGDGSLSRSSSKGKGTITMTKPNRAFQLRRARADSFEEPTTPRSGKSVASTRSTTSGSSVRSSSVHGSSARARSQVDTNRSEATSLGAQIVKKSQNNVAQDRARRYSGTGVTRTDGGRNSLRLQRASSLTISQPSPSSASAKKEPVKPHLRSTPTGKGNLSISGIGSISSRSQSQPGSRSNSPKAAERLAWKRRKDYDPRRAVAEAKAKAKESGGSSSTRPKPKVSHNSNGRIIRSASFTNSPGHSSLSSLSVQDSVSSFQSSCRAFHPFPPSHRSAHSADEDDSLVSTNSDKASYDALIVSSIYQISLKLKTSTDKCLIKLRDQNRVSQTPSPVDDFLSDSGRSEITAWKSANQELAGILKNLRKLERHVQMISTVLFPEDELNSEVSSALPHLGAQEKQKYYQEMKRIRSEIAGFQPIHHPAPDDNDVASPEMAELTQNF